MVNTGMAIPHSGLPTPPSNTVECTEGPSTSHLDVTSAVSRLREQLVLQADEIERLEECVRVYETDEIPQLRDQIAAQAETIERLEASTTHPVDSVAHPKHAVDSVAHPKQANSGPLKQICDDTVHMQGNDETVHMQGNDETMHMQSNDEAVHMQSNDETVHMQSNDEIMHMQGNDETVHSDHACVLGRDQVRCSTSITSAAQHAATAKQAGTDDPLCSSDTSAGMMRTLQLCFALVEQQVSGMELALEALYSLYYTILYYTPCLTMALTAIVTETLNLLYVVVSRD